MDFSQLVALSIFTSYFLVIISLFSLITSDLRQLAKLKASNASGFKKMVVVGLTFVSFAHTWFYMFKYMAWSFTDYGRALSNSSQSLSAQIASWLRDTSLFQQAWYVVCVDPLRWWWSEQLCLFTVGAWTILLATEGRRLQIKHLWAYMLLGQLVAISVSANLFHLAAILSSTSAQNRRPSKAASPSVWFCILAALAAVAANPFTSKVTFLPNLLAMHALLFIPVMSTPDEPRSPYSMNVGTLFNIVYITSTVIRLKTIWTAWIHLHPSGSLSPLHWGKEAWSVLHSHPAQASIGWDVIWTSISFIVWVAVQPSRPRQLSKCKSIPYLMFASPLASIGVTAPYVLRPREEEAETGTRAD